MKRLGMRFGMFIILAVMGCSKDEAQPQGTSSAQAAAGGAKTIDVTLALNWYAEAEHGGFYAALVHGIYEEEGLKVTIRAGGPGVPVITDVASGKIEFAVDNADKLLLLRAQEADVVAVMSPIQNSPRCIMVHQKSGLTRLEDLAQRKEFTLAINQGQPFARYMAWKLNLNNVRVIPFPGGIANFLEESNFGQQAYSFSEPFIAEKKGSDPQCLMLSEIGFNTYTSMLITRRELIEQKSDLVARMTRASIRGWKKYFSNPDETNAHIHSLNPEMGLETLAYGVTALKSLCFPEGFEESQFGQMSIDRWQTLVSQMIDIDQIKPNVVKPEDAFTLKYVASP